MVKTRNDFSSLTLPTAIEEAKKLQYDSKDLEASEKTIFDSALLKGKDASNNEIIKLDEVKDTAALLFNFKEASDKLEEAKKRDTGLDDNEVDLLIDLMDKKRLKSTAYKVITEDKVRKGKFNELIRNYQFIATREDNRTLATEEIKLRKDILSLEKKGSGVDNEIQVLEKNYNQELVDKQTTLEANIDTAVTALKNDLRTPGAGGRNFFDLIVRYAKIAAEVKYKSTTPATADAYGSIIETGYTKNGKPYTHPIYLRNDLPAQIWEILKNIDKNKLFEYVDSSDCTWDAGKKERFKASFSRTVNLKLKLYNVGKKDVMIRSSNREGYKREDKSTYWHVSDIFYVMHALFPKDSNYQDSPFLKVGEKSCLSFNDTEKSINTPYAMYWRGADDSIRGVNYSLTSPSLLRAPFPGEEKHLTWADGQIPEFFWQVYNNDEAIDFSAYHEVLSPDAVNMEKFWKETISVYEKKIHLATGLHIAPNGNLKDLAENYAKYVESLLKNLKDTSGKTLIDVDKLRSEWKNIAEKMIQDFSGRIEAHFSQEAKAISYDEIVKQISIFDENIVKLIETYKKGEIDQVTEKDVISKWDEWKTKTAAKKETLKTAGSKLGEKLIERNLINAQINQKNLELTNVKTKEQGLKTAKVSNLRKQLKYLGKKITSEDVSVITRSEAAAIRNFYWLLLKLEKKTSLGTDADGDNLDSYVTKIATIERKQEGLLKTYYATWKGLGSSFDKRLAEWKDNEGLFLEEESVRYHLEKVKGSLNEAKKNFSLSPEEEAELSAIISYLKKDRELSDSDIRLAFDIYKDISSALVDEWRDYGDEKYFAKDNLKLRKIGDSVNKLEDKEPFFNELKIYIKGQSGVPAFPNDSVNEFEKLDYYFTLSPKHVIGAFAAWKIKTDADEKKKIEEEMKDVKDANNIPLSKDKETGYGDGTKFTDEGIIKYYSEKTGGIKHSYRKQDEQKDGPGSKGTGFWSWDNPTAIVTGSFLIVGTGLVLAGVIWWEKLAAWWDGPADAEGNGDDDEENE